MFAYRRVVRNAYLDYVLLDLQNCMSNIAARTKHDGNFLLYNFLKINAAALALIALTLPVSTVAQETAIPAETVKATYGDWDLVCSAVASDQCTIRQFGTTADGQKVLVVHIRKLEGVTAKDGVNYPAAIQITAPLGTILRAGVNIIIDEGESRTGGFEVCIPNGCILRDPLSEEFLDDFKGGSIANMSINVLQKGTVTLGISLKGFSKAFKKL